jgi:hypothetical protein
MGGQFAGAENDWQQTPDNADDAVPEVTHMTSYTFNLCGVQMGRLDSFKRHKRSHQDNNGARCDL